MSAMHIVILDTNIVLDIFLFQDPRTGDLRDQLHDKKLNWVATQHMRNELERVLTYTHIEAKLAYYQKSPADILAAFDQFAQITTEPSIKAPYTCKDADDQPFIDLACHLASQQTIEAAEHLAGATLGHLAQIQSQSRAQVQLISKDKAVLAMRKRLEKLSVMVTMTHLA